MHILDIILNTAQNSGRITQQTTVSQRGPISVHVNKSSDNCFSKRCSSAAEVNDQVGFLLAPKRLPHEVHVPLVTEPPVTTEELDLRYNANREKSVNELQTTPSYKDPLARPLSFVIYLLSTQTLVQRRQRSSNYVTQTTQVRVCTP